MAGGTARGCCGIVGADACWPAAFPLAAVCFQIELIAVFDAGTDIRGSLRRSNSKEGARPDRHYRHHRHGPWKFEASRVTIEVMVDF
jgi:hypothetical protein